MKPSMSIACRILACRLPCTVKTWRGVGGDQTLKLAAIKSILRAAADELAALRSERMQRSQDRARIDAEWATAPIRRVEGLLTQKIGWWVASNRIALSQQSPEHGALFVETEFDKRTPYQRRHGFGANRRDYLSIRYIPGTGLKFGYRRDGRADSAQIGPWLYRKSGRGHAVSVEYAGPEPASAALAAMDATHQAAVLAVHPTLITSQKALLAADEQGRLYAGPVLGQKWLLVTCPSTGRLHAITVPNYYKTPTDARAWTLGVKPHELIGAIER